jgi:hypothetical protein
VPFYEKPKTYPNASIALTHTQSFPLPRYSALSCSWHASIFLTAYRNLGWNLVVFLIRFFQILVTNKLKNTKFLPNFFLMPKKMLVSTSVSPFNTKCVQGCLSLWVHHKNWKLIDCPKPMLTTNLCSIIDQHCLNVNIQYLDPYLILVGTRLLFIHVHTWDPLKTCRFVYKPTWCAQFKRIWNLMFIPSVQFEKTLKFSTQLVHWNWHS